MYRDWEGPIEPSTVQRDTPTPVVTGTWTVWIDSANELSDKLRKLGEWRLADRASLYKSTFVSWRASPPPDAVRVATINDFATFFRLANEHLAGAR